MFDSKDLKMTKISWWRTNFGENTIRAVTESMTAEHISQGPVTAEFESQMAKALDVPYVVATTSGSTAILMALMALGIKPGDEVIVPNRSWIATAHAPLMLGAKVVLVDVLPDIPIMDASEVRQKITSKTKAIIPVTLNGRAVDMEQIWSIAEEYGLLVVEDAAQGLFSKYSGAYMGTGSHAGCFSLSIAKLLPTGQGGFVVTNNKKTYEQLRRIRTHGVDDVINCTFHQMGFNFRFTDLQASIGCAQLDHIQERIAYMTEIYQKYEEALKQFSYLKLIPVSIEKGEFPIYVEVLCEERDQLISFLASHDIETRPFYPDLDTADYLECSESFSNTRKFGKQGLVLPCGPGQTMANIDQVIKALKDYGRKGMDLHVQLDKSTIG